MKTLTVMLCVNDPDNGSCTGRIVQVDIESELIHLEGPVEFVADKDGDEDLVGGTEFTGAKDAVTIGGARFPHLGYSEWVGNWCWDSARMSPSTTLALLNHLKRLGWSCTVAESGLFERWRQPGDLKPEDLEAAIHASW